MLNEDGDKIPCEFCGQDFPFSIYAQHTDICGMNPSNLQKNADNALIPCEFCGDAVSTRIYENHIKECQ